MEALQYEFQQCVAGHKKLNKLNLEQFSKLHDFFHEGYFEKTSEDGDRYLKLINLRDQYRTLGN